ncbi:NAC domain containing protein 52-like [Lycium barbarum]|uniref:NAC domain containing protein 52-like n=1 Tax=Lycium barbarum TaxID=112863 RepID=UPI00293E9CFC|nr:NAC domain containing protein 52-like [Lycium barbarum]
MELVELAQGFCPTDSELLTFLLRFIAKEPLCDNDFITEHDVYKQEPWETYSHGRHCGGQDNGDTSIYRYFITPTKKKHGRLICRTVRKNIGTWKQQDKGKDVVMKGLNNGRKNSLCYESTKCRPDDQNDGKWLMTEYEFSETVLKEFKNFEFKDNVICALRKKSKKKPSNGIQSSNLNPIVMGHSTKKKVDTEPLLDQEYKAISPINIVEKPTVESAGEENGALELSTAQIQEFENNQVTHTGDTLSDKNQIQYQPTAQQEGCIFGVHEDHIAYLEL